MADANVTTRSTWTPLAYTTGVSMPIAIRPEADIDTVAEHLHAKLWHLEAMLAMTCGGAGMVFRSSSEDTQESFLFGCSTIAEECRAIFEALLVSIKKGGAA